MGIKTIGLRGDVYERLKARKRDDKSFTDLVNRLLDEEQADWREGFGTLDTAEVEELERAVGERVPTKKADDFESLGDVSVETY